MKILFNHNSKSITAEADAPASVKLYAVPVEYSDDGYYIAQWIPNTIEPVPACATEDAELLAHIDVITKQDNETALVPVSCKEGVTYAAH